MTRDELMARFPNAKEAFLRLNAEPERYLESFVQEPVPPPLPADRLRQSKKPLLNQLETEFFAHLKTLTTDAIFSQAITLKLANGVKYTPDFVTLGPIVQAYEVKGDHAWDDAIVKLKVAASLYPQIRWTLAWKDHGHWFTQHILP